MQMALYLAAGFAGLYFGAEWLVRGSASLATRLGLSPLLVGLTVVAYGTSAPELIVSCVAALKGQGPIAVGNAVSHQDSLRPRHHSLGGRRIRE